MIHFSEFDCIYLRVDVIANTSETRSHCDGWVGGRVGNSRLQNGMSENKMADTKGWHKFPFRDCFDFLRIMRNDIVEKKRLAPKGNSS